MTRQTKTPKQRAEEAIAILNRRLARLKAKKATAEETVADLDNEVYLVKQRLRYAKQDPALTTEDDTPLPDAADSAPDNPDEETNE